MGCAGLVCLISTSPSQANHWTNPGPSFILLSVSVTITPKGFDNPVYLSVSTWKVPNHPFDWALAVGRTTLPMTLIKVSLTARRPPATRFQHYDNLCRAGSSCENSLRLQKDHYLSHFWPLWSIFAVFCPVFQFHLIFFSFCGLH